MEWEKLRPLTYAGNVFRGKRHVQVGVCVSQSRASYTIKEDNRLKYSPTPAEGMEGGGDVKACKSRVSQSQVCTGHVVSSVCRVMVWGVWWWGGRHWGCVYEEAGPSCLGVWLTPLYCVLQKHLFLLNCFSLEEFKWSRQGNLKGHPNIQDLGFEGSQVQ